LLKLKVISLNQKIIKIIKIETYEIVKPFKDRSESLLKPLILFTEFLDLFACPWNGAF